MWLGVCMGGVSEVVSKCAVDVYGWRMSAEVF